MQIEWWRAGVLSSGVGLCVTLACVAAQSLEEARESVRLNLPLVVFFQATLPDNETRAIAESFRQRDAAVVTMNYMSRGQAYEEASKDPLLARSLMLLRDNPLSAAAELIYSADAWRQRPDPALGLRGIAGVQDIRWSAARRDEFLRLDRWRAVLAASLWGTVAVLLLWSIGGVSLLVASPAPLRSWVAFVFAGLLGGAVSIAVTSWISPFIGPVFFRIPLRDGSALPLLLGGIIGMGSFRLSRA